MRALVKDSLAVSKYKTPPQLMSSEPLSVWKYFVNVE